MIELARNRKTGKYWLVLLSSPFCAVAQPDLEGAWMLDGSFGGSGFTFTEARYTGEGQRRHDAFNILTEDPSLERIHRDGDRVALEITYADPIILTEPVHIEYRLKRCDYRVVEYDCTPENAGYDGG